VFSLLWQSRFYTLSKWICVCRHRQLQDLPDAHQLPEVGGRLGIIVYSGIMQSAITVFFIFFYFQEDGTQITSWSYVLFMQPLQLQFNRIKSLALEAPKLPLQISLLSVNRKVTIPHHLSVLICRINQQIPSWTLRLMSIAQVLDLTYQVIPWCVLPPFLSLSVSPQASKIYITYSSSKLSIYPVVVCPGECVRGIGTVSERCHSHVYSLFHL
jgi:hypothetical protein